VDVYIHWQFSNAGTEDIEAHLHHIASLSVFADELCLWAVDAVDHTTDSRGHFQASHVMHPVCQDVAFYSEDYKKRLLVSKGK
jgi:hypothetical protein